MYIHNGTQTYMNPSKRKLRLRRPTISASVRQTTNDGSNT